jgi:mRNA-degrading endonuclease toxin of MazEF toxin-antitoxin module
MDDRSRIPFSFPGRGRVELTIAHCRRLCPRETAALLDAARALAAARAQADQAEAAASAEFERRLGALQAALLAEARRRAGRAQPE